MSPQLQNLIGQKSLLRKELRMRLRNLSATDRQNQSENMTRQLLLHPKYQASGGVAVFCSMPDEIDTNEIIKDIFARGKCCYIPRYV